MHDASTRGTSATACQVQVVFRYPLQPAIELKTAIIVPVECSPYRECELGSFNITVPYTLVAIVTRFGSNRELRKKTMAVI